MASGDSMAFKRWERHHLSFAEATDIDPNEPAHVKLNRRVCLEADPESWYLYYFPKYCKYPPTGFHKKATRRFLETDRLYDVRAWSRGFSKSTRTMFDVLYLALTGKAKNILLVSYSYDNAETLLLPYKINLEKNKRIINDYGEQYYPGRWESGSFVTLHGCSFLAVGAGQSPRGSRNEEVRPDVILIDDIDTDEECRNQRRINEKWEWVEQALIPTVDISENYRILFCGNLIAKDCCITRAMQKADHADVVNLVNKHGHSNWPEKVRDEDIFYIQNKVSYVSFQKEYMNNPLSIGTVFKDITWKKILPIKQYRYLVCYTDPSFKESRKNDYKATVLIGKYKDEFHILRAFVEQTTTAVMVDWHYQIMDQVGDAPCYYLMEANLLQDIILEEFYKSGKSRDRSVPIKGDERKKGDKFTRIESLLEPLNRNAKLIFNIVCKDDPHMLRLEEQFKALGPGSSAHDDGPDAVEGGVWFLNNKERSVDSNTLVQRNPRNNKYRY